jgi:dTDP-4-amino-4,6-dideoxygalactose transaminase
MPDLCATVALGQLDRFDEMQRRRNEIAATYLRALEQISGVEAAAIGRIGENDRHSWCFFPVSIHPNGFITRDAVAVAMREANIGTSVHYIPSHKFSIYRDCATALPVTDAVWGTLLSLPLFPGMSDRDVTDVIEALSIATSGQRFALA